MGNRLLGLGPGEAEGLLAVMVYCHIEGTPKRAFLFGWQAQWKGKRVSARMLEQLVNAQ